MYPQRIEPGPGQESVWDYPRPPRVELASKAVRVVFNEVVIAQSDQAQRVLETSHPPTYYIPPEDVRQDCLEAFPRNTFCEWKGAARYFTVKVGDRRVEGAVWCFPEPTPGFEVIQNYLAFYPSLMDACFVGDEKVESQAGDFYGGWITKDIVGPFKGGLGTWGW